MKNNYKEIIITFAIIIIAILLLNPFNFWMPDLILMCMLALILGLFSIFTVFILRENTIDERDAQHRALAGRNAFLFGSGILILGIVIQGYTHSIDPWLVIALITMIIVKIITRVWSEKNL